MSMVEWKKLGDVCEVLDSRRKPVSKGKRNEGVYPYYGANGIQDYVDDYIFDGAYLLMGEDGSVINADKSPVLHWATGKIWVNNHAHVLAENNSSLLRYLYYILQCTDVSDIVRGVPPKINQANMRNLLIPIPSLQEQQRIVGILDTFTSSIENLKEQITQRRKQYEYYRDQLLDLEGKAGVEMKNIKDIALTKVGPFGSLLHKKDYIRGGVPLVNPVHMSDGFVHCDDSFTVSSEMAESLSNYRLKINDIVFARRGEIGRCAIITDKEKGFLCGTGSLIVRFKEMVDSKYMLFIFLSPYCRRYLEKNAIGGSMLNINCDIVNRMSVPLPPLQEQQRIVSILDTFEASIRNLEEQLAQRQKQYEYYRNKLLTFE